MAPTMESLHQTFQRSDASLDVEAIVRWLDRVDGHPLTARLKRSMLEVCPVSPGDRVLDVGCGLGHEVSRLAERVGRHGQVVGIDASAPMIAEARRRAAETSRPVEFAALREMARWRSSPRTSGGAPILKSRSSTAV
jgi:ubiquinone/menaquinone biosynthesis C-methylase UbiE